MSRPGFVLEVDDRTPALLVGDGAAGRLVRLPRGTQVVYPNEADQSLLDADRTIAAALAAPDGAEPLAALLHPGTVLTVVVTGLDVAPMADDIRRRAVEAVLDAAAAAHVDDIRVLIPVGPGRRLRRSELVAVLGPRVVDALAPDHLIVQHDLTDDLADLGATAAGEPVTVNARLAASDLVVTVNVVRTPAGAGVGGIVEGASGPETLRAIHGHVADLAAGERIADVIARGLPVWAIDVVTDQHAEAPRFRYLTRREWEWNLTDRFTQRAARALGPQAHRAIWESGHARGTVALHAGDPAAVAAATRRTLAGQQDVGIDRVADVVLLNVPGRTPYNIGEPATPLTAAWSVLAGLDLPGGPLRPGGAVIVRHPLSPDGSPTEHQATGDFLTQVLSETRDPAEIHDRFEERFATDAWYAHIHRAEYAFAGILPVFQWYAIARAAAYCGDIVWVGADRASAARMGMRAATTLADALEIVSNRVGPEPVISYLHSGPTMRVTLDPEQTADPDQGR